MPPLLLLGLGVVAGVTSWPALQPPAPACLAALPFLAVLGWCRPRTGGLAALAVGLTLGWAAPGRRGDPAHLLGEGWIRGTVMGAASGREAEVWVSAWSPLGAPATPPEPDVAPDVGNGRILVRFGGPAPPPGSRILAHGDAHLLDLTALPGEPDLAWIHARSRVARRFLAREVVVLGRPRPPADVGGARHGGLLKALWNGDRTDLPQVEADLLRRTGTWHLVSISGLHVGLAATGGWALGWLLTRPLVTTRAAAFAPWIAALIAVSLATAYTGLSGWSVPAVRSLWMSGAALVCLAAGRRPGAWEAVSLGAIAVLLPEPAAVATPAFQLSFGGVIGILLLRRRVLRLVPPDIPLPFAWLAEAIATSVGATAGTLPAVAWYFQDLSPLSVLANLWAVPWIGTIASPAAVFAQILPGSAGRLALSVGDAAISVGLWGLDLVDVPPLHPAVGPLGALLLALAPLLSRWDWAWIGLPLLILGWGRAPIEVLRVTFLPIGQGDSALVEWPGGATWLIDGGPSGDDLLHFLRRRGIDRLDRIVLSHPHPDHLEGLLPVVEALPVGEIFAPRAPLPAEISFQALIRQAPLRLPGPTYTRLAVLHPLGGWRSPTRDPTNDESLTVRFGLGKVRLLFPGDLERAGEEAVAALPDIQATILKVAHHGSDTSSTARFVRAVDPELAIVSCGFENRYGHPRPRALAALRGRRVLRTDQDGTIVFTTDGATWTVRTPSAPERWRLEE